MDNSPNNNDPFREMIEFIKESRQNIEKNLPEIEALVNTVIVNAATDSKEIEHLLDTLSSFMYMGIGHGLYVKLLDYYKAIDASAADFYWQLYEEINE